MDDPLAAARAARGPFERLAARLPGLAGCHERELGRAVDEMVRRRIGDLLDEARFLVHRSMRDLPLAQAGRLERLGRVERGLDAAARAARAAGSGYAGSGDAGRAGTAQVEALVRFDMGLLDLAEGLRDGAAAGGDGLADGLEAPLEQLRRALTDRPHAGRLPAIALAG